MHTIIKIAVVSVLALFAIVGVISLSEAETWSCSYLHDGEANILVTERKGDTFIQNVKVGDEEIPIKEDIIFESEQVIHLHATFGYLYYATILNKERNSFSSVALNGFNDTVTITGKCVIN